MAETIKMAAEPRKKQGSADARRLRRQGRIPAVLYGHKEATVSVTLPGLELEKAIRHGAHVVDLQADGKTEKALIRDVQWDHLGKHILHVDFARVSEDERIVIAVPFEIRGTPAGINEGGVLDQPMHTIEVECLAIAVPDHIRVNVSELRLGQALHVKDLALPEGVKAMSDPDQIVVHVTQKQLEAEAPAVAVPGAAESGEPEVIGRQKAEEEPAE
jgi:large subunit ribosomal protein L25